MTFKNYLEEQMRDPEFAAAYAEIGAEVDREYKAHSCTSENGSVETCIACISALALNGQSTEE